MILQAHPAEVLASQGKIRTWRGEAGSQNEKHQPINIKKASKTFYNMVPMGLAKRF